MLAGGFTHVCVTIADGTLSHNGEVQLQGKTL